jgi:hypothetical protein
MVLATGCSGGVDGGGTPAAGAPEQAVLEHEKEQALLSLSEERALDTCHNYVATYCCISGSTECCLVKQSGERWCFPVQ